MEQEPEGVFALQLDEQEPKGTPSPEPNSTPGCSTPINRLNSDIAIERRVIPLLEYHDDCCPVCLDEYTTEDPGAPTVCGHHFHLQCIMQWAQRSRECPLCFKSLQLEDTDMNSLLPFGEYISPQQRAAEAASLETWDLERLLVRLAAAGHREHRSHRSARQHGGGSSRHRRQGSRGEASAPQPIAAAGGAGGACVAAVRWALPGEGAATSSSVAAAAAEGDVGRRAVSAPGPSYPSSWPPALGSDGGGGAGSVSSSMHDEGHVVSPRSRSGSLSLKGRLASLRLKDKFEKTTKELKSLFSPGASGSGGGSARGGAPGASTSQQ